MSVKWFFFGVVDNLVVDGLPETISIHCYIRGLFQAKRVLKPWRSSVVTMLSP